MPELSSGRVLLLTDDVEAAAPLVEWITRTGLEPVPVAGSAAPMPGEDEEEALALVVADVDTGDARSRALVESLAEGRIFRTTPKLYIFRDAALLRAMRAAEPALEPVTMIAPVQGEEFRARVRLAVEIGRLERLLARHSVRDGLTGLTNRRYLLLRLEEEVARARRYGTPVSLVLFDIDHLKEINDGHGQTAGDAAIRHFGRILRRHVRRGDAMGRLGADVFGVVLSGSRYRGAAVMANKIRTEAEEADLEHEGTNFAMRVSAGISTFPDNKMIASADDLVRVTEDAVRRAKSRGGNRVFIDEGVMRHERRVILVADPDAELLELAEDLLTLDDFQVVKAGSPSAALDALRSRLPDLAVVEMGMRESDRDPSLIERIQELYPGSRFPIVGLLRDGSADPDTLHRLGVDRFITKPFSLTLLRSAARELLESYKV